MSLVICEKKDSRAIITFNDPEKMNGLSVQLVTDLLDALEKMDEDDDVRAIILTGTGKIFSAGGDISVFDGGVPEGYNYLRFVLEGISKVEKLKKPVIAAVNGFALGGGCEISMACDIAIASEKAVFGLPEVGIGIMPGFAVLRLHQIVGRTKAKELILTGKQINANEAERIGLINRVVPADKLMDAANEEAELLISKAPFSLAFAKSIVNRELGGEEVISTLNTCAVFFGLEDLKEGRDSFFEKRKPVFKGK